MWFHVDILDPVCSDPEVLTSVCVPEVSSTSTVHHGRTGLD